jgi:hypothetical protein
MPNMTDEDFAKALGVSPTSAGNDMFELALREAEKSREPKRLPSSVGAAERFIKGASAQGYKGMMGIKRAFTDLSPEEVQALAGQAEWVKQAGMPAQVGQIASEAAMLSPSLAMPGAGVLPALQRAYTSGSLSALFEPGGTYEREKSGALGAVGSLVGETIPYAAGTITRAIEPLTEGGKQNIIARSLQRVVGENAPSVASQLETTRSGVPGVQYTASEAAPQSGGLAAMQRWAEQANPESYFQRRAENVGARRMALQDIAGSEAQKAAALGMRESVTKPMYEEAMQISVPVNESLRELFKRPSMRNALSQAQTIAAEQGTPIPADLIKAIESGEVPAEISGQGLHWLKIGLDSLRDEAKTSLSKAQQNALKGTVNAFEEWRGQNIPKYAEAQAEFKRLSQPISRMDVGQSLYEKLAPSLSDFGPVTRERAESFAGALRDADVTAQRATGFKGAKFSDIMKQSDQDTYSAIASDLSRQAESAGAGRGIGSNTFQNLAMQNLAERAGFPGTLIGKVTHLPGIDYAYTRAEQAMQRELADILLDPKKAAKMLRRQPGTLLRLLEADFAHAPGSVAGAAIGSLLNR